MRKSSLPSLYLESSFKRFRNFKLETRLDMTFGVQSQSELNNSFALVIVLAKFIEVGTRLMKSIFLSALLHARLLGLGI